MTRPLYLAIVWHMHQPSYLDLTSGKMILPWVRLHACKDYLDMVEILSEFHGVKVTFNLVPSLMDQLELYSQRPKDADAYLELSYKDADHLTELEKHFILDHFFQANLEGMIQPYWRYFELYEKNQIAKQHSETIRLSSIFTSQDFRDLQVWFNLAWVDPKYRGGDSFLKKLVKKGEQFTEQEKCRLLEIQIELVKRILPAYRRFQQENRIEVSVSPYYHPILPLLYDVSAAKEAFPAVSMPKEIFQHPEDARWQIESAVNRYREVFGTNPRGFWPSEGSVSQAILPFIANEGFQWIASDEQVLFNSLQKRRTAHLLYRPYRCPKPSDSMAILFRDHNLSDLIGFTYSRWPAEKAAENLINHLKNIQHYLAKKGSQQPYLATLILDGENAWEYYPNDGADFLRAFYGRLSKMGEEVITTTPSEYLQKFPAQKALRALKPGSWIDGNFNVWIGDKEKNLSWDYLAWARRDLERLETVPTTIGLAWRALAMAQGSDWNWWYGNTHFTPYKEVFDKLYRHYLAMVYQYSGQEIPEWLSIPICQPETSSSTSGNNYSTMHKSS
ncbi:MAG: glycoside hydrolase [Candidatus Omnitrophica bacterium]|nr:glycoside hydrolase [Candidatus Omnitrophota bacterium]